MRIFPKFRVLKKMLPRKQPTLFRPGHHITGVLNIRLPPNLFFNKFNKAICHYFLLCYIRMTGCFFELKEINVRRGDIRMLFNNKTRLRKYITSIIIGIPIWFVVGILITFSPEFGKEMGLTQPADAGKAVLFGFAGQVAGNVISGWLSQYFQSRKKVIFLFMIMSILFFLVYLLAPFSHAIWLYLIIACLGFCSGYWTLFITVAAELFGSNL
ncbi:MAG: MFS transporter, partial [Bacteroidetes bacterium]|nr:MFS transporter [Bacteroidota bacterium]